MIRKLSRPTSSAIAVMLFCAVAAHAEDSPRPKPMRQVEEPLSAEQAQAVQKAWAEYAGFDVEYENSIGMKLRVIPPGTFRKGTPEGMKGRKSNEGMVEVTISQAYLIGQYELTQKAWQQVMGPMERSPNKGAGDRFPKYSASHADACEFCEKLTQIERDAGVLPEGYEYRLPTGAEWEYACRAGTLSQTYFGESLSSHQANFDGNRPLNGAEKGPNIDRTTEVGSYPANAWGLHDMHGNLCEWCLDWYHDEPEGGTDPVQLEPARNRLLKDCHWGYTGFHCKSANRYWRPEDRRSHNIGFRPVLTKIKLVP